MLFGFWALGFSQESNAQDWAVKTNLLYDATTSINLGVECSLAEKIAYKLVPQKRFAPVHFDVKVVDETTTPVSAVELYTSIGGSYYKAQLPNVKALYDAPVVKLIKQ